MQSEESTSLKVGERSCRGARVRTLLHCGRSSKSHLVHTGLRQVRPELFLSTAALSRLEDASSITKEGWWRENVVILQRLTIADKVELRVSLLEHSLLKRIELKGRCEFARAEAR